MLELKKGRPETKERRLDKEERVYNLLDELEIEFMRVDHEAAMTMEACLEVDEVLGTQMCKNLFLCNRQETDFYLLLTPGDKKFFTKDLSKALGVARLSFAKENYMEEFLDITPGSVSVMGLMNDKNNRVKLVIDDEILAAEEIGCHPCINTSSLKFKTSDLIQFILPAVKHDYTVVNLPRYAEEGEE